MYTYKAKVLEWIDGDTLWVEIDLGFYVLTKQKIRLARIDAPELQSNVAYRERQAKHARAVAKKFCSEGVPYLLPLENKTETNTHGILQK